MKPAHLWVADYDESEKSALNKKMIVISICGGVVIALIITVIGLVIYAFHQQYNSSGISSLLCITIDENQSQEYIG
jgi:hypothetical protein